jgi:hypothetical protein
MLVGRQSRRDNPARSRRNRSGSIRTRVRVVSPVRNVMRPLPADSATVQDGVAVSAGTAPSATAAVRSANSNRSPSIARRARASKGASLHRFDFAHSSAEA